METANIASQPRLATARMPARPRPSALAPRPQGPPEKPPTPANRVTTAPARDTARQPHLGGATTDSAPQSLLEQLKADWGKTDSPWDLNEDGIVNVRDFLKLLAKISGGARDAVPIPAAEGPPRVAAPAEPTDEAVEQPAAGTWLEQLRADWGKTDSPWDLNEDGIVNVRDFLKMLAKISGGAHDAVPPEPATAKLRPSAAAATEPIHEAVEQPAAGTWIEQLRADWGKTDSPWDLNEDGIVNVRDFLKMLAKISGGAHDAVPIPPTTTKLQPSVAAPAEPIGEAVERPTPDTWVDRLLADWGDTESLWDLNGDGTVNVRDFLKVLGMMGRDTETGDAPRPRDVPRVGHVMRRALAAYGPAAAAEPAPTTRGLDLNAVG